MEKCLSCGAIKLTGNYDLDKHKPGCKKSALMTRLHESSRQFKESRKNFLNQ